LIPYQSMRDLWLTKWRWDTVNFFFYSAYSGFSSLIIIPPVLHTYIHLHFAVTRKTSGLRLGAFQNRCSFGDLGAIDRKVLFTLRGVIPVVYIRLIGRKFYSQ
jgi:hypothetical protein